MTEKDDFPAWVYLAALIVYVALGLIFKTALLNWIVGPLFLVFVLGVFPAVYRRLTTRDSSR